MKLWKKILSAVTAGVLCLGSVGVTGMQSVLESMGTVLSASADSYSYGALSYEVTDAGDIVITNCSLNAEIVEIPSEIDGKSVTSIGWYAFGCTSLTSITIPDSVTSIGEDAFSGCTSLIAITIPDSVTSIEEDTFYNCTSLEAITIPDSVTSIGIYAFYGCTSLAKITIPDSVTRFRWNAFFGTPWLAEKQEENPVVVVNGILIDGSTCTGNVVIPDSVMSIGEQAFLECTSLTSITIPDSVTSIGEIAFSGCENLAEITIPDSVTSIGEDAFFKCDNLTIYGYTNSYAETYAKENGISFVPLDSITTTETTTTTTIEITTTETTAATTTETAATTTTKTTAATTATVGTTVSINPDVFYGDVTLDGDVDLADAVLLNKAVAGSVTLNQQAALNADCNSDGKRSADDSMVLLKFLVHLVNDLPYTA